MCGIVGFMGTGNIDILNNMTNAIKYRGPDAQASYIDNNIALGHVRLSILDLRPEANQPMFSNDNNIAITYNGEIYNFLLLKKELEGKYIFKTSTDTEVLLYLYMEHGIKMLEKINGMFAFAIYDFTKKELFIAKDRMGKKPLYYTQNTNSFVFASELKALLMHPSVDKELNIESINQYLTFDYVPTPNSIIKYIYKLESGHYILVKNNKIIEKKQFWLHDFTPKLNINFNNAKEELGLLLNIAVKDRLMSDAPLGVFLSGGLDSSTVAYYAQKNSNSKIKTFSIGFENNSYNESHYAQQVANHLGTDHYSQVLTPKETLNLIDEIYPYVDEPFADASLIPTYYLSKFTRKHVTVAIGGDGSDELMAGYPTFISNYFKQPFELLPKKFINAIIKTADYLLPISDKNISFDFKIKQYLRGFLHKKIHTHQLWLGSFTPNEKKMLFKPDIYNAFEDKRGLNIIDKHFNQTKKTWSDFEKTTYYYYKTYLLDDILVKVDRASMYNSLEVRAPFLDKNVVEFLNSLPKNFKQKGFISKYILKKLMEDKLPRNIIYRQKKGFGIPLSDWIRTDLKDRIKEVLLSNDELFNKTYINTIIEEHLSQKRNHRKLIWNLFVLKQFLANRNLLQ